MNDENKVGLASGVVHSINNYTMSEAELLRDENIRLKLELEQIKYKLMEDDVEKGLDLYHYFIQHYHKDTYLSLVKDGKFLEFFSKTDVKKCQMFIDKYSYDDLVKVVKNFYKELTAKMVLKQKQEQEEDEDE